MFPLVANEVLRVEEPLSADRASVRPLITAEMDLKVAASERSMRDQARAAGRLTSIHNYDRTLCCSPQQYTRTHSCEVHVVYAASIVTRPGKVAVDDRQEGMCRRCGLGQWQVAQ